MSQCRQNYHEDCVKGVNDQINLELYAMYTYLSLSNHYERDDVALLPLGVYFRKSAHRELEHAQKLMKFQNDRGGRVELKDVSAPERSEWGTALDGMQAALALERRVNQALLDLHQVADSHGDVQMSDFIDDHFLTEQVAAIKELADHITNLKRVGPGHGEYDFVRHLK